MSQNFNFLLIKQECIWEESHDECVFQTVEHGGGSAMV